MTKDFIKPNGCYSESGFDAFEEDTRLQFEDYAKRKGYDLTRDSECTFFYAEDETQQAWEIYHQAHVRGREFILKSQEKDE